MLKKGNISMCIYCGTTKYRKIYENHVGPIPRDDMGRKYEIHHIDGNKQNNDISNLVCLSIEDHYEIHYSQGDWAACLSISGRANKSPEEKSELARRSALQRLDKGNHPFLLKDFQKNVQLKRLENGTHHWQVPGQQATLNRQRVENGTHNFLGGEISRKTTQARLSNGTHHFLTANPSKEAWTCQCCGKTGKGRGAYNRWHGINCRG
jgi:hypothetical protein